MPRGASKAVTPSTIGEDKHHNLQRLFDIEACISRRGAWGSGEGWSRGVAGVVMGCLRGGKIVWGRGWGPLHRSDSQHCFQLAKADSHQHTVTWFKACGS